MSSDSDSGIGEGANGTTGPSTIPLSDIYERFAKWRDYCATKKQCCEQYVLGPDEEAQWFNLPIITQVATDVNTWAQICPPDPLRVLVAISCGFVNNGAVYILPSASQPDATIFGRGLAISTAHPTFIAAQEQWGGAISQAWWVLSPAVDFFTAVDVTLKLWPVRG